MATGQSAPAREELVPSNGVELAVRQSGDPDGPPVIVMHGLFGTRDYVLMGSTRLEDAGYRVIAYDARGHGRSTAPPSGDQYEYDLLLEDLIAVMGAFEVPSALLLGVSMGAHTSLRLALEHPERVAGVTVVTPAYDPDNHPHVDNVRKADKLAAGLRRAGAEGFMEALEPRPAWGPRAATFRKLLGQRMRRHRNLHAVADALEVVMRARPFGTLAQLESVTVPAAVVASRDDYETDHPYDLALRYAEALPNARLVCEPEGKLPVAWSGGALAAETLEVASRA